MPTKDELLELKTILLTYALGLKPAHPFDRQQTALAYVLERHIAEGNLCKVIQASDIDEHCPSKKAQFAKESVHNLMREIGLKLAAFYKACDSGGTLPEHVKIRYRVEYKGRGNYALNFPPYLPKKQDQDFVSAFWKPHLPPHGTATILYVEPLFLMDERRTFFRNASMGTQPDPSSLSYLQVPGAITQGYSYVPSGVVQALLLLTKAIRRCDNQWPEIPAYVALKPSVSTPPGEQDLIVLATPTSTELVATLQKGQAMTVDASGVHYNGTTQQDDEDQMLWGIVTRTRQKHRVITLLAARHGRSVEAMTEFLTRPGQLALLLKWMGRKSFPENFQVMFRMPVARTREGPSVVEALIGDVCIPPIDAAPGSGATP